MKVCPNCGKKFPVGSYKFCNVCGTQLVDDNGANGVGSSAAPASPAGAGTPSSSAGATASAPTAAAPKTIKVPSPSSSVHSHPSSGSSSASSSPSSSAVPPKKSRSVFSRLAAPDNVSVKSDGRAFYLAGITLYHDNVSEILLVPDSFDAWLPTGLVLLGVILLIVGGEDYRAFYSQYLELFGFVLIVAGIIIYIYRRVSMQNRMSFVMNSGDRINIISNEMDELNEAYPKVCQSVAKHQKCSLVIEGASVSIKTK